MDPNILGLLEHTKLEQSEGSSEPHTVPVSKLYVHIRTYMNKSMCVLICFLCDQSCAAEPRPDC